MGATEMVWTLSQKEKTAVSACAGPQRYKYFISKVCDEERIWSLWSDGWSLARDVQGNRLVPVWPHRQYAEICARDQWEGYLAREIKMEEWLNRWIDGIKQDGCMIAVFPTADDSSLSVGPDKLVADLMKEFARY